jgi:hypothetical protein
MAGTGRVFTSPADASARRFSKLTLFEADCAQKLWETSVFAGDFAAIRLIFAL